MLLSESVQGPVLLALSFVGLVFAVLSILEKRVQWIASLCSWFGEGCRKTEVFTLFTIPISWWGVAYYLALGGIIYLFQPLVFWLVMAGLGMELIFFWILIKLRIWCIFCFFNGIVIALLALFVFEPARIWEATTIVLVFYLLSKYFLYRENELELTTLACEMDGLTAARVNDDVITTHEVDQSIARPVFELKKELYQTRRKQLDKLIEERLLQKDAREKDMTMEELLDSILSGTEPVGDDQIDKYISRNRQRFDTWQGTGDELREKVRDFLNRQEEKKAVRAYTIHLSEKYDVQIFLQEPVMDMIDVPIGNSPALGPDDAPVTVVEFSDYLCPACKSAHKITNRIKEEYRGHIRWVFKDFPLPRHKGAEKLAEAARCAQAQGRFWEFQDKLFFSTERPDRETLLTYGRQLELDMDVFTRCLNQETCRPLVQEDMETGHDVGITATPSFIINGKAMAGCSCYEDFAKALDDELEKSQPAHVK